LYANGVRSFVEVGPKKALKGFVDDVLNSKPDVVSLFSNHPKTGELASFNQVLCGLYAAGYGVADDRRPELALERSEATDDQNLPLSAAKRPMNTAQSAVASAPSMVVSIPVPQTAQASRAGGMSMTNGYNQPSADLGQLLLHALNQLANQQASAWSGVAAQSPIYDRNAVPLGSVVISGTGLGLPGAEKPVMD